jgi:hypothetical protein
MMLIKFDNKMLNLKNCAASLYHNNKMKKKIDD